ncbi:MAG: hypothetical protein QOC99_2110 [Acidobacteriota bacterium]|jgi:hypothetical protein|nr:hypothetical protein [Acidobacteriota bacterium]MDT7779598.1 hypothetical protein [Acidobacteriota bacterium]
MDSQVVRISQLATRMQNFAVTVAAAFNNASLGGQKFAALNGLIAEIDQHSSKQALARGSAQTSTTTKKELRAALRQLLKAIRDTAISLESELTGISKSFRIPISNGDEGLVASARAFVEAATPLKARFISREMPATFLDDLTDLIQRFEESTNKFYLHRGEHTSATASLKKCLSQVITLRRELDPIVRNKFRDDPATLAMWESASHLERKTRKPAPTTPPAAQS